MDASNLGLYNHTLEELKYKKGISENEEYLDRIGSREWSAIDFKNTLATGELQDDRVAGNGQVLPGIRERLSHLSSK